VAYQCLAGRLPFEGGALAVAIAHVEQEMPPLPPWIPAPVAALVTELTSKDPAARPSSAADVAARAEQARAWLSGPPDVTHALEVPPLPVPAALPAVPAAGPELPVTQAWPARQARSRTWRVTGRMALAPLALSGIAAVGLVGWMLAAGRSAPVIPPPPAPAATARPGHHGPGRTPAAVPAARTATVAPAASPSRRPRVSRASAPAPSPSAAPGPSPAAGPSPAPSPSPAPDPSPTATAPAVTPPPSASPAAADTTRMAAR